MKHLVVVAVVVLGGCFSKPGFSGKDAGSGDDDDGAVDAPPVDPTAAPKIAAGGHHACMIDAATKMVCWGDNAYLQLGLRGVGETGTPGFVTADLGWTTVASGQDHSCGVRGGAVYCWGRNDSLQSLPEETNGAVAVQLAEVTVPGTADRVFAGGHTTCAVNTDHDAYCWGSLNFQVAPLRFAHVTQLMPGTKFTHVAISEDHACAIKEGGAVVCWGAADQEQLGQRNTTPRVFDAAQPIEGTELYVTLAAGTEATCGVTAGRKLLCWGSNNRGQLGTVAPGAQHDVQIGTAQTWSRVASGYNHTCAIGDGNVYCWGDNDDGALGNGAFARRVSLGTPVVLGANEITAGFGVTCATLSAGGVRCWGSNENGELGNGKVARKTEPALVGLPTGTVQQLVTGDHHACALIGAGSPPYTAYCWGLNAQKQLNGTSLVAAHSTPILASATKFTQLAAGAVHTCGLASGGASITCWGENGNSELGSAALVSLATKANPAPGPWTYVAAGLLTTCAISAGELYCWGAFPGYSGNTPTATPLGKLASWPWSSISIGRGFAVGIALDTAAGDVPHLGAFANDADKCSAGFVSGATSTSPVEIFSGLQPLGPTAAVIAAQGGDHTCVQRKPGSTSLVTCWGSNTDKQTGVTTSPPCGATVEPTMPPTWAVSAAGNVALGSDHSCALAADRTLFCWGANDAYELGPLAPGMAKPRQLFAAFAWTQIATGRNHTCGLREDGNVYCWGANKYGEAGDGSQYEPAPVAAGIVP